MREVTRMPAGTVCVTRSFNYRTTSQLITHLNSISVFNGGEGQKKGFQKENPEIILDKNERRKGMKKSSRDKTKSPLPLSLGRDAMCSPRAGAADVKTFI